MLGDGSKSGSLSELVGLFQANRDAEKESLKPENLRYILYARKSTVDEGRQEKSIPDQISDCLDRVVIPNHIKLDDKDIIEEKGSAKEPDIRKGFRGMLNAIIAGKYDGIICWHPDRLARNMKEAGEIIDFLDKGVIKDLRFATSTFENSPTGKMLLGMSFVMSKQYSEHLSESVERGNRRKTEDGYFLGKMKHGYYISDGRLFPDGENYGIIQKAFNMRLENASQAEIQRYLNSRKDYSVKRSGGESKAYKWDKDSVSKLLRDTFYVGVLKYGNAYCVLRECYDFTPAITEQEFLQINPHQDLNTMRFKASQAVRSNISAKLLNNRIYCGDCNQTLSAGIITKNNGTEQRFRYRCETRSCPMYNKGPRAKIVTDFCIDFLDDHQFTTKSNYENYKKEMGDHLQDRRGELSKTITSLVKQKSDKERESSNALRIASDPTHRLAKRYEEQVEKLDVELAEINKDLNDAKSEKKHLVDAIVSYEKYLELFKNVAVLLRSNPSLELLDKILLNFFSKLVVKGDFVPPNNAITRWEVIDYKLKEPYAEFLKSKDFECGRGERT